MIVIVTYTEFYELTEQGHGLSVQKLYPSP